MKPSAQALYDAVTISLSENPVIGYEAAKERAIEVLDSILPPANVYNHDYYEDLVHETCATERLWGSEVLEHIGESLGITGDLPEENARVILYAYVIEQEIADSMAQEFYDPYGCPCAVHIRIEDGMYSLISVDPITPTPGSTPALNLLRNNARDVHIKEGFPSTMEGWAAAVELTLPPVDYDHLDFYGKIYRDSSMVLEPYEPPIHVIGRLRPMEYLAESCRAAIAAWITENPATHVSK